MRTKAKNRGVTLVEMMIVVGLIGILGSIVATFYRLSYRQYQKVDAKTKVTQVAVTSLGCIQKQLREITQQPACTANTTLHPTLASPVSFKIPSLTDPTNRSADDQVDYYLGSYNGKNVFMHRLVRGATTYGAIPVIFDFDKYRTTPTVIPQGGGVAKFLDDTTLLFDDVAFYYDDTFDMVNVGITVSVADRGKSGVRERITLTTAVAIRNTF